MKLDELFQCCSIRLNVVNEDVNRRGVLGGLGAALFGKSSVASVEKPPVEIPDKSVKSPRWVKDFITDHLPLIQKANKEIEEDRARLLDILHKKSPSDLEKTWLDSKMTDYNCTTPEELVSRMDIVPVSLALTQAALESGWGKSDLAKHHALFGQKTWSDKDSIRTPRGERYKKFSSPEESIKGYMRNINSNPAYKDLRKIRERLRKQHKPITGLSLATGLTSYSTTGSNYVEKVKNTILTQGFYNFDPK